MTTTKEQKYQKEYRENHKQHIAEIKRNKINDHQDETLAMANNHYRNWDSTDICLLTELSKDTSVLDTASLLGRTYRAVENKAGRLGIGFRH